MFSTEKGSSEGEAAVANGVTMGSPISAVHRSKFDGCRGSSAMHWPMARKSVDPATTRRARGLRSVMQTPLIVVQLFELLVVSRSQTGKGHESDLPPSSTCGPQVACRHVSEEQPHWDKATNRHSPGAPNSSLQIGIHRPPRSANIPPEAKSQMSHLLQPASVSCAQPGGTVLQQDQALP